MVSVATVNFIRLGVIFSSNNNSEPNYPIQRQEQAAITRSITDSLSTDNDMDSQQAGHYETIEETITRLKRDVVVTGTITGALGQESAMFQIEGMADRLFKINTQLMDGFIIKEITTSNVVLKNQVGNETFSLYVQSGKESSPDSNLEPDLN
jgi:hypothetical protein